MTNANLAIHTWIGTQNVLKGNRADEGSFSSICGGDVDDEGEGEDEMEVG